MSAVWELTHGDPIHKRRWELVPEVPGSRKVSHRTLTTMAEQSEIALLLSHSVCCIQQKRASTEQFIINHRDMQQLSDPAAPPQDVVSAGFRERWV